MTTILLLVVANAVLVQWSTLNPQGWESVSHWASAPKQPDPAILNVPKCCADNRKGWIAAVKIGDQVISGWDHYRIVAHRHYLILTAWHSAYGGRGPIWETAIIDTYREGTLVRHQCFSKLPGCASWASFRQPSDDRFTRHGIWIAEPLWEEHRKLQ